MARVDFSDVDNDTQEIVGARPRQFIAVLSVLAPCPVRVRQHVKLQGELHLRLDLCCALVAALFVFEALREKEKGQQALHLLETRPEKKVTEC